MEEINYYTLADDYHYFMDCYNAGIKRNAMASLAQSICERYLKYLIDTYCEKKDLKVMHAHRLKILLNFLQDNLTDIELDETIVCLADNFYFATRYPGDDSFFSNEKDIDNCKKAIDYVKEKVDAFCEQRQHDQLEKLDIFNDLPQL